MEDPPDNNVLRARSLHCVYQGTPALADVSVDVREGEVLAVTGPRGSGKTTLLRCLSGQLTPRSGEVWFDSIPLHGLTPRSRERLRRDHFGWIDPEPHLVPELTGWENAALPLMLRGASPRTARAAAMEWMERLDVADCARKRPAVLPKPQRQRIAVARALAAGPTVLFADDPSALLHRVDRAQVMRTLMAAARSHGMTAVLATHDPDGAALADRTVALADGRRAGAVPVPGGEGRDACSLSV
jgi:putative ABC transport system ATP-binding protein